MSDLPPALRRTPTPRRVPWVAGQSAVPAAACGALLLVTLLAGCAKPSAANIALRKQVQGQADEIERLKRQHAATAAAPPASTGPAGSRPATETLFTTHGIRLGRLTRTDDDALSVHLTPIDDDGDDLKAAGAITVDAYDLTGEGRRIGHWAFDAAAARPMWVGRGLRYEYVVACPWPKPPAGGAFTVKVTFVDALTGRSFDTQQKIVAKPE